MLLILADFLVSEKGLSAADSRPVDVQQRRPVPGGAHEAPRQLGATHQGGAQRGRRTVRVPNHDPPAAIDFPRTEGGR